MALPRHEQTLELMKRAQRPVIVLAQGSGVDGYTTGFACQQILDQLGKTSDIVAADGPAPKTLDFLQIKERVRPTFGQLRKFVVTVDLSKAPLDELSYNVEDHKLQIYLTPKDGIWSEADIHMHTSTYRYDLILVVGAASLDALGELYTKHSEFFYETPMINIDHVAANEHYGQVNLVDITATSSAEVLVGQLGEWPSIAMTEALATTLLTGMIAKTQSFKTPTVTPKTLKRASALMRQGARREDIVDNLYRTRTVETLRLWGRALARLKNDEPTKLVWSLLSQQDFIHAGAREEDLPDVIEELIKNAPMAEVVVLLYEDHQKHICGLISTHRGMDSVELSLPFKPTGTRELARICFMNKTIVEAEKVVIESMKERIKKFRV
ncbi:TPA: hypothetical protein DEB00_03955 [Candidatus Uhrbacteria bacterium]|nr:hypothetical protein [Candidatus Uhrbacteria bacterium]